MTAQAQAPASSSTRDISHARRKVRKAQMVPRGKLPTPMANNGPAFILSSIPRRNAPMSCSGCVTCVTSVSFCRSGKSWRPCSRMMTMMMRRQGRHGRMPVRKPGARRPWGCCRSYR